MKKTQWSYIKDFILEKYVSTKEGITIITKQELLDHCINNNCSNKSVTRYLNLLCNSGFLQRTDKKGIYKMPFPITSFLSTTYLIKLTNYETQN